MKTKVFASVRNFHRPLQLAAVEHIVVFFKYQFAISHEQNNLFHLYL